MYSGLLIGLTIGILIATVDVIGFYLIARKVNASTIPWYYKMLMETGRIAILLTVLLFVGNIMHQWLMVLGVGMFVSLVGKVAVVYHLQEMS